MMNALRAGLSLLTASAVLAACGGGGGSGGGMATSTGTGLSYAETALVSDSPSMAYSTANTDPNLVNGWGLAFNPAGFAWVADNGTARATLYDGSGVPQSPVVTIPAGQGGNPLPTGIVFNGSQGFMITQGGASAASMFIFVGQGGTVSAWSPSVNPNTAVTVFDGASAGAVYTGLTLASQGGANFLYAADFHNAAIDIFDSRFIPAPASSGFIDPALPPGYAPFGIQAIGNRIIVTYAKQDARGHDAVVGAGLGVVDVFDPAGTLIKQLIGAGGALNAPWGVAMAPANFGPFSNALLIGNLGDGKINAFDPNSGAMLGTLSRSDGSPIAIDGLWGIAFGNGLNNQPANTLFFAAGPNLGTHGVFGRIDNQ